MPDGLHTLHDLLSIHQKKGWIKKNNVIPPVQIYVNKNESRITFELKNGHSLELVTLKTMEWLGSSK